MLGKMFARAVPPRTDPRHDRLFTPFAPNGAPPRALTRIYNEYADALPDEFVPPQHRHFRAQIQALLGKPADLTLLHDATLKSVYALYAACFERAETFNFQLVQHRANAAFRQNLIETRNAVIADLLALEQAEQQRRVHLRRWDECQAADIDLSGEATFDLIRQMNPDDWHEIALHWNWDDGVAELNWITSQRACDRATAVYVMCTGRPGLVATTYDQGDHRGFIRTLAARLENGFYPNAELGLGLTIRQRRRFETELEMARATGESPWQLTRDLVAHPGRRHAPKYTLHDGRLRYHYDYWLAHVAPKR